MDDDGDKLIYIGAGPLAAVLLGMALVPVRAFTIASNFTFLFLALTILVGEFGRSHGCARDRRGVAPEPRLLPHPQPYLHLIDQQQRRPDRLPRPRRLRHPLAASLAEGRRAPAPRLAPSRQQTGSSPGSSSPRATAARRARRPARSSAWWPSYGRRVRE